MLSDRDLIEALLAPEASPTLSSFWATVASVSPLRVIPPGEEEPVPVSSSLVAVSVGNVVFCMILGNQLMIMGSASQDDPNELVIGGSPYVKITGTNVTNGTTTKTWANILAANPSSMSEAEAEAGTATTARTLTAARLKVAAAVHGTPTGAMMPFAGATAPTNYLLCQGQAVSRTTYAALFAVIGVQYGAGDGSTTFNVPDMRGYVPVGLDPARSQYDSLGLEGGEETHTLSTAEMPAHDHGGSTGYGYVNTMRVVAATGTSSHSNHVMGYGSGSYEDISNTSDFPGGRHTHSISSQGGTAPHNNMPPYIVTNYIIKT